MGAWQASVVIFLALVATLVSTALNVVFIGAAVAFHTVVKFSDAFFNVLTPNVVGCVLVAAVAGVAAVVITHMAGHTAGVVVTVQNKIFVVVKSGRSPFFL